MPVKIQQMAKKILKNPEEIKLAVSKPAEKIRQSAYICYETQKLPLLKNLFSTVPPRRVIIFSSSKIKVKNLARELRKGKINVGEMHSDLDQNKREEVMMDFKAGRINVVVATDIISRGIDIDDIEMVINYDVPREAEDYVHRIGRTARADRDGSAVTFVAPDDFRRLARIERLLGSEVNREALPGSGLARHRYMRLLRVPEDAEAEQENHPVGNHIEKILLLLPPIAASRNKKMETANAISIVIKINGENLREAMRMQVPPLRTPRNEIQVLRYIQALFPQYPCGFSHITLLS